VERDVFYKISGSKNRRNFENSRNSLRKTAFPPTKFSRKAAKPPRKISFALKTFLLRYAAGTFSVRIRFPKKSF